MTRTDICPEPKSLLLLASGQLPADDVERLAKHLESCVRCVETVAGLKAEDTLVEAVRASADTGEIAPSSAVQQLIERLKGLRGDPPIPPFERGGQGGSAATLSPSLSGVRTDGDPHDFLAPAQGPDELGRLGPYRILRELGGGGMGTVFLAEDPQLQRFVALKTMKPSLAASSAARERFIREARATAKVKHDNVVTIHQVGEDRAIPFIAMELLEGETLDARLKREPTLPCPEVLRIGQEIARGLSAAHKRGLLHRDIKPANIWLENRESVSGGVVSGEDTPSHSPLTTHHSPARVKIVDFGLARAASGDAQLTQEGAIIGTPAYMAPEQATNTNVDHRCDLFSLGCVLYRMAAGVPPFKGTDTISTLMSVATDLPEPPHTLNREVPRPLSDFIMKLLEKSPERRPASAQEVAERLREFSRDAETRRRGDAATIAPAPPLSPSPAPPVSASPRRRVLAIAAAVALLALGILGYFYGGTIIRIATNEGELVIEIAADAKIEVTIKDGEAIVHDKAKDRKYVLTAGKDYEVHVRELGDDGVKFGTKRFTITRGGKAKFDARIELAKAKTERGPTGSGAADSDRRAAEWVLSIDGKVSIDADGKRKDVAAAEDLPTGTWKLVSIDLADNKHFTNAGLVNLKGLTNLKELSLDATGVNDAGLIHLKTLTNLTFLRLSCTPVGDAGLEHLKGLTKLTTLDLGSTKVSNVILQMEGGSTQVSDVGLKHLEALTNLTSLDLAGTRISDAGLVHLKGLTNLRELWLHTTQVSDAGLVHLKGLTKLTNLGLDSTGVSDAGLVSLKEMTNLKELRLQASSVNDAGLVHLKGLTNLTRLWLHTTRVSDAGLVHLKGLTNLTELGLHATKVTAAGVDTLQKALPKCKIESAFQSSGPDRRAAEYILSIPRDFSVAVQVNDAERWVGKVNELPAGPFRLTGVFVEWASKLDDTGLAQFEGCKHLKILRLWGTQATEKGLAYFKESRDLAELSLNSPSITDAALELFRDHPHLTMLHVQGKITDAGLFNFKNCKKLTMLGLRHTPTTDVGLALFKDCKNLKHLDLGDTRVTDVGLAYFKDCKDLDTLILFRTKTTDAGLAHFKGCKKLKYIDLGRPGQVTDVGLANFQDCGDLNTLILTGTTVTNKGLAHLKGCTNLTGLTVDETAVTDECVDVLKSFGKLANVGLKGTKLTEGGVKKLAAALPKCRVISDHGTFGPVAAAADPDRRAAEWVLSIGGKVQVAPGGNIATANDLSPGPVQLTLVSLRSPDVTEVGLANLKDLPHLRHVYLGGSPVTDAGLAHLAGCKNLSTLSVESTKVSDDGLAFLKHFTQLKVLGLHNTRLSDAGLAHVKECKSLSELDVSLTQITDAGLKSLEGLTSLQFVQVYQTKVSADGVKRFAAALPRCKIRWDGGVIEPTRFTNTLGMEFALVPKGKAWLGGGGGKPGTIEKEFKEDFYLGVYEVTQEEWEKVMRNNPSHFSRSGAYNDTVKDIPDADLKRFPVEHVLWDEVQLFMKQLNERDKQVGWIYRLPTEAEWEYACRGGQIDKVPSAFDYYLEQPSNDLQPGQANFEHIKGLKRTCKVGMYAPNALGLHDMHGNVWEWCDSGDATMQGVCRGGSCFSLNFASLATAANRFIPPPRHRLRDLGLRVARAPVAADSDRRAAEWVLSIGGSVRVNDQGAYLKTVSELPSAPFRLAWIALNFNSKMTDAMLPQLQGCENLIHLDLGGTKITDAGMSRFPTLRNLTYLSLGDTPIGDAGLAHIKDCKNLKGLYLAATNVTDQGLEHLEGLKTLTSIRLTKTHVTEAGARKLAAALPQCRIEFDHGTFGPVSVDPDRRAAEWTLKIGGHLEILQGDRGWTVPRVEELPATPFRVIKCWAYNNTNVTDDGLSALRGVTGTLDLSFDNTPITDAGLAQLKDCQGIWALHIGGTKISDDGLKHLAGLTKLCEIWLDSTPLTSAGLAHLKALPALETVGLNDTRVDDAVFQHLANLPLRRLHIRNTKVTDAGLAQLKTHKKLVDLDLQKTAITDAGLTSLEAVKSLEQLNVTQTKVTVLGVKKLAAALPQCKIVSDYGTFGPK